MELFDLYLSFAKIGFTSFGGISMLPLIFNEVTSHGWLTASEVTDIVAIAEMTPGPIGLNCATFAGLRVAGVVGAIISVLGVLMPILIGKTDTLGILLVSLVMAVVFTAGAVIVGIVRGKRLAKVKA